MIMDVIPGEAQNNCEACKCYNCPNGPFKNQSCNPCTSCNGGITDCDQKTPKAPVT